VLQQYDTEVRADPKVPVGFEVSERVESPTDARETSRPILQSLGFIRAASETTWVLLPVDFKR
jgi:hypothetical protein